MGKNTSTQQILQIGKNNNRYTWESKYFEKHITESQIYLFRNLEIKKFITNFLKIYGLNLYKYNINFSESRLKIFISYFKTSEIKNIISKINADCKIKLIKKEKKKNQLYKNLKYTKINKSKFKINKNFKNKTFNLFSNFYSVFFRQKLALKKNIKLNLQYFFYKHEFRQLIEKKVFLTKLKNFFFKNPMYRQHCIDKRKFRLKKKLKLLYNKYLIKKTILSHIKKLKLKKLAILSYQKYLIFFLIKYNNYKNLLNKFLLNKKLYKKRLKVLRYYKTHFKLQSYKTFKNLETSNFLKQLTESLNIFTQNKFNNTLILQEVNKNTTFSLTYKQLQSLKKLLVQLRQFKNSSFFKEGLNVILITLLDSNNISLLGNFIATQLKMTKRHGFFFKFLAKTLSLSLKHKFSRTKSIKILIKGRINGKPRSKQKLIFISKHMPLMTINSSINFNQCTSFSSNGTFGIKLWLNKS